jgi:hypothetical protein
MGDAAAVLSERVSNVLNHPLIIIRWQRLRSAQIYQDLYTAAEREYWANPRFLRSVDRQVCLSLKRTLPVRDPPPLYKGIPILHQYVLHEVAGLIYACEFMEVDGVRFPCEVYPGDDLDVLVRIYSGEFPSLRALLPAHPVREFVNMIIE